MDPYTLNIIISLAVNYFSEFSIATVKGFFNTVIKENPKIETKIKTAETPQDFEEIFNESVGIIDAPRQ